MVVGRKKRKASGSVPSLRRERVQAATVQLHAWSGSANTRNMRMLTLVLGRQTVQQSEALTIALGDLFSRLD